MSTPVLAFLQNMWVRDPERLRQAIERGGEQFRLRMMRYSLFAGCKTGRNLKKAFGEELLERITFEETTREIAGDPKTIFPADLEHMRTVLVVHRPRVVVSFGAIAEAAVKQVWAGVHIHAHHPASRHPDSMGTLYEAARRLREFPEVRGA